jgi:hypothetical protein
MKRRKEIVAVPNSLEMLASGDEAFFKLFDEAFNVVVGHGKFSPAVLLDSEEERKWDGVIRIRNNYVAKFVGICNYTINSGGDVLVGFRKVADEPPVLTLYYGNDVKGIAFAIMKFESAPTCSRVINYLDFAKVRKTIFSETSELSARDIYGMKNYLSLLESGKNDKVYKAEVPLKI